MRSVAAAAVVTALMATSSVATSSQGAEKIVHLKPGTGLDRVEANCGGCHSLDYVAMNSPFLNAAAWDAEVTKMISAFGAPIDQADAKIISDYLKSNYGQTPSPPPRVPTTAQKPQPTTAQKPQGDGLFPPLLQNNSGQRNGSIPGRD
jgi:mono/diheme cytochrome c family protein